jgi:hypothetical protein
MDVFWDAAPRNLVDIDQPNYMVQHTEDSNLYTHHCENLKSHQTQESLLVTQIRNQFM